MPNENNYSTIWQSLVDKYQDKRALGTIYLNNILDIGSKHMAINCNSKNTCKQCNKKHHSLIHFVNNKPVPQPLIHTEHHTAVGSSSTAERPLEDGAQSLCMHSANSNVALRHLHSFDTLSILPTAQVYVVTGGRKSTIRCLIDSASQNNIITRASCIRLNLDVKPLINSSIKTLGSISTPIKGYVSLTIQSRVSDAQYNLILLVVDNITEPLPAHTIDKSTVHYFEHLSLADESWNAPGNIDAILGAQMFAFILLGGKVIPPPLGRSAHSSSVICSAPHALETTLGYIVMGEIPSTHSNDIVWSFGPLVNNLNNILVKFWQLEQVPSVNNISPENKECEQIFKSTVARSSCGRYIVSPPFKSDPKLLGNSFIYAQRRLTALERRFHAFPALRKAYNEVIVDYIENGYLSEIPYSLNAISDGYFIPHHAIFRPDKSTKKTRIVLDASAKTDSGVSLNDLLHIGPNLQADLFTLLLRFRYFEIALNADIKQMYLRIFLSENDRKYQKILYHFADNEPNRIFQFNSVAFSLRSSPYLAMRTVRQLAEDERERFPLAAEVATQELFMDDLTTSVHSVDDGIRLADELRELFKSGGFNLVKWASNSHVLLTHLPESHRASIEFSDDNSNLKVLGLKWIPTTDTFTFTISSTSVGSTKRAILSTIARLFDVLGFVAPVILYAKLLIQELWLAKVEWDQEPPETITERFIKFKNELSLLANLQIPRHLGVAAGCTVHMLAFGDASIKAYGCVLFLHVTHPNHEVSIHFVCAKSKVAPLKTITLARLELCAALLASELVKQVHSAFHDRYSIDEIYVFSDSTIALSWIHSSPHRWQVFVANRHRALALRDGYWCLPIVARVKLEAKMNTQKIGSTILAIFAVCPSSCGTAEGTTGLKKNLSSLRQVPELACYIRNVHNSASTVYPELLSPHLNSVGILKMTASELLLATLLLAIIDARRATRNN
ncbi:uncharacterized protein LOC126968633 [Leptidea sinapis]|uniref:uncharacterized protein LOC126968633 n=1 Tax=Leptidea sinapis TaxID=189913 RepID=UPI0021C27D40|nr:uncharacterized protein LOC126968633 [Leptidea sinapis]